MTAPDWPHHAAWKEQSRASTSSKFESPFKIRRRAREGLQRISSAFAGRKPTLTSTVWESRSVASLSDLSLCACLPLSIPRAVRCTDSLAGRRAGSVLAACALPVVTLQKIQSIWMNMHIQGSVCNAPLWVRLYVSPFLCLYIYTQCYIAFRPICCLLFLAETTQFAFFGGKLRRIKDNKKCIFGTFWSPFFLGHFWL